MKARALVVLLASPAVAAVLALASPVARAQPGDALVEQGRTLYDANCVTCHQANGAGTPPAMPALAGNERLSDADHVVRTIRLGRGAMLSFPKLSAGEVAALASYIRNAWGNKFSAVTPDQVTTILAALPKEGGAKVSIWSGVYTAAQNERGQELYGGACSQCHGDRLNGAGQPDQPPSPAIARAGFLRKWSGQTVAALFNYIYTKMPPEYPGTLTPQQSIDSIAYMFAVSNIPPGGKELPADAKALEGIVIEEKPKK